MMRRLAGIICMLTALVAEADNEALIDSVVAAFSLHEVVITGTRTAKSLKDTPVQTRLISRADLRTADAANLQDLLQQELPGVEFSYAMNQQVNMNLAGFSGLGVLVLVDGERLAGETMDNVDFSRLPMHNVERVEIVKGAASALYGSNAAGGVINIITRKPRRGWEADLSVRGGAHGEWRAGGLVGLRSGCVANSLDINYHRTGSYDVCLDLSDQCDYRRVYANKTWNFSDRLTITPADNVKLAARAGYYFKERLYNPDTPDRCRAFTAGVRGSWAMSPDGNLEAAYVFDQYDKSDYIAALGLDLRDYRNVQHSVKLLGSHAVRGCDMLTAGADLMRDRLETYQFSDDEAHTQYTAGVFAQYDACLTPRLEAVGAVRWDWYSDRGANLATPKISLRYRWGDVTLRAGYAGAFRAPSLKEKYMLFNMADIFDIHGNSDLRPEKSHNFNVSAEYTWRNLYFMASGHYDIVTDKIGTTGILHDSDGEPYIRYINVERLRVTGIDASVKARWGCGLSATVSYNFTHEATPTSTPTQYCPARPHSLSARATWTRAWRKGLDTTVSLSGRMLSKVSYESMRMYEPFEAFRVTNPAYTLWKLQLTQTVWPGAQVTLCIDNLLNYRPRVYSFNAPVTTGTTLLAGLNIDIDKLCNK